MILYREMSEFVNQQVIKVTRRQLETFPVYVDGLILAA
jgi:hypothetical protein